jgi:hypothetical protein
MRVFANLKQLGNNPIELEQGSMSFEVMLLPQEELEITK